MEDVLQIAGAIRRLLAWLCGIAGLLAYNWWALAAFKPGLMRSPDEFFSNLEVTGQPYASLMQRADVTAGVLLLLAFLLAGNAQSARRERLGMVVFAVAGAIGGIFPQVCADSVNAGCLSAERHFQLAVSQYLHDASGVIEFAGITLALWFAARRTRAGGAKPGGRPPGSPRRTTSAIGYKILAWAALIGYPVLGVSYLFNIYGGIVEGLFFIGFTTMVLLQLAERLHRHELSAGHKHGTMSRWEQIARRPAPR